MEGQYTADLEVRLSYNMHVSPLKWKKKGQIQKSEDVLMLEDGGKSQAKEWDGI